MKKCPFCAEMIQDDAIKCRYCHEFLDGRSRPTSTAPAESLPWYFKTSFIVGVVLCAGPLGLPLIWWHPKLSATSKVLWTALITALTILLYRLMVQSIESIYQLYDLLPGLLNGTN